MPIEIKELHIKAIVSPREKENSKAAVMNPDEINKLKSENNKSLNRRQFFMFDMQSPRLQKD